MKINKGFSVKVRNRSRVLLKIHRMAIRAACLHQAELDAQIVRSFPNYTFRDHRKVRLGKRYLTRQKQRRMARAIMNNAKKGVSYSGNTPVSKTGNGGSIPPTPEKKARG